MFYATISSRYVNKHVSLIKYMTRISHISQGAFLEVAMEIEVIVILLWLREHLMQYETTLILQVYRHLFIL
jgi:hypothetical protein